MPSTLCAIAVASTAKKRASKRLGRFGGVIARAMKCKASRSGKTPASLKAAHGPSGTTSGAPYSRVPIIKPVSSKVSRMAASPRARARDRVGRCTRFNSFSSTTGCSAPDALILRSSLSMRPPGKTNLPGMNLWPGCRLPINTFGFAPSRSIRINVAASFGLIVGQRLSRSASVMRFVNSVAALILHASRSRANSRHDSCRQSHASASPIASRQSRL